MRLQLTCTESWSRVSSQHIAARLPRSMRGGRRHTPAEETFSHSDTDLKREVRRTISVLRPLTARFSYLSLPPTFFGVSTFSASLKLWKFLYLFCGQRAGRFLFAIKVIFFKLSLQLHSARAHVSWEIIPSSLTKRENSDKSQRATSSASGLEITSVKARQIAKILRQHPVSYLTQIARPKLYLHADVWRQTASRRMKSVPVISTFPPD